MSTSFCVERSISKKACCQVSCSSRACDWTTGRKRSHGNSNQLQAWAVISYLWQPMTSQSASSISDAGRRVASVQKQTRANQRSQNAYITQPALFSKRNRIRATDQTKIELLHSLQFTAP